MRTLTGAVVSDKMKKTVVVAVTRMKRHSKYLKSIKQTSRFKAHDEENACKVGDTVTIQEVRPMSRGKRWRVIHNKRG